MGKLTALGRRVAPLRSRLGMAREGSGAETKPREARNQRAWRKWYGTARWQTLRMTVLTRDLFTCQWPGCGRIEGDTSKLVADHRRPHRGVAALFWDITNVWTLCASCHSSKKQREEVAASMRGDDLAD